MANINGRGMINEIPDKAIMKSDRAEPNGLNDGDFVQWDSSGGTAKGKIESIKREGSINVPGSEFTINATAEDPAALIRIYSEGEDGWEATETLVGHKFSTLTKIAALRAMEGRKFQRAEMTAFAEMDDRT